MLSSLTVSYDDPDYLAGVVFERLVYGSHPYGLPDSGTPASIAGDHARRSASRSTKRWFGANNAILAIVGDVTADEAFAGAERPSETGARPPNSAARADEPRRPRPGGWSSSTGPAPCRRRSASATSALPRKHPDYLALDLAIKILGGEGGNRLHRVLRSERGLTYGASADLNALKETGDHCRRDRHPVRDDRRSAAADRRRVVAAAARARRRARAERRPGVPDRQLSADHRDAERDRHAGAERGVLRSRPAGAADLPRAGQRGHARTTSSGWRATYLHPDRLSIVLVGDASRSSRSWRGAGFDQFESISVARPGFELADAAPARTGSRPPRARRAFRCRDRAARFSGHRRGASALIDRAVRGKGGSSG